MPVMTTHTYSHQELFGSNENYVKSSMFKADHNRFICTHCLSSDSNGSNGSNENYDDKKIMFTRFICTRCPSLESGFSPLSPL